MKKLQIKYLIRIYIIFSIYSFEISILLFFNKIIGIRPSYSDFEYFVNSCGAKILYEKPDYDDLPSERKEKLIVVVDQKDEEIIKDLIEEGFKVYQPEFLYTACMRQDINLEEDSEFVYDKKKYIKSPKKKA